MLSLYSSWSNTSNSWLSGHAFWWVFIDSGRGGKKNFCVVKFTGRQTQVCNCHYSTWISPVIENTTDNIVGVFLVKRSSIQADETGYTLTCLPMSIVGQQVVCYITTRTVKIYHPYYMHPGSHHHHHCVVIDIIQPFASKLFLIAYSACLLPEILASICIDTVAV